MCKNFILFISFILVLALVPTSVSKGADPDLVALWMLDDGSGTTAIDSSAFGNNGTLMGDPQWVVGQIDGALEFDGDGDYVDCGNDASYNIPVNITLAAWIKVGTFDTGWQAICNKGDSSWRLHRSGSSNNIAWGTTGLTPLDLTGSSNANDGAWHHYAGVYNGTQKILYHNGDVDASVASTGNIDNNTYNVMIGENAQSTGRHFLGTIDDVRIYRD
jgi:hypothetical protein